MAIALLPGVADGMDMAADAVVALTTKVIAELTITVAQIAAAAATAAVTLGASAAATAAIIVARKKALDILTDLAVEQKDIVDTFVSQLLALPITRSTSTSSRTRTTARPCCSPR